MGDTYYITGSVFGVNGPEILLSHQIQPQSHCSFTKQLVLSTGIGTGGEGGGGGKDTGARPPPLANFSVCLQWLAGCASPRVAHVPVPALSTKPCSRSQSDCTCTCGMPPWSSGVGAGWLHLLPPRTASLV